MSRLRSAMLLPVLCATLPGSGFAQGACRDGRTSSGQCVNSSLAAAVTQSSVIYSQPKLSYTHYPVLPTLDWSFRYPNQLNPDPLRPTAGGVSSPSSTP